jgi:hypothetical protein
MSSIIRWRKGETLRAVRMGIPRDVVSLMGSNRTRKLARTIALGNPAYIDDGREKKSRTTGFPRSGLVHCRITPSAKPTAIRLPRDTFRTVIQPERVDSSSMGRLWGPQLTWMVMQPKRLSPRPFAGGILKLLRRPKEADRGRLRELNYRRAASRVLDRKSWWQKETLRFLKGRS